MEEPMASRYLKLKRRILVVDDDPDIPPVSATC
jgi:hypothetical protein